MRRNMLPVILVAVVAAASACALQPNNLTRPAPDIDRTLTTFSFIEEGELVTFVVDTRATRDRDANPFIPFEIAVGNRTVNRLNLTRESFTLVDDQGNRYPCVGPKELLEGYNFLDFDRKLGELPSIVSNKFGNFTRYPSMFSPVLDPFSNALGSTVVRDAITLPRFGYFIDFIYFPRPVGGVNGKKFELFLESPDLKDPVFVKFIVR